MIVNYPAVPALSDTQLALADTASNGSLNAFLPLCGHKYSQIFTKEERKEKMLEGMTLDAKKNEHTNSSLREITKWETTYKVSV